MKRTHVFLLFLFTVACLSFRFLQIQSVASFDQLKIARVQPGQSRKDLNRMLSGYTVSQYDDLTCLSRDNTRIWFRHEEVIGVSGSALSINGTIYTVSDLQAVLALLGEPYSVTETNQVKSFAYEFPEGELSFFSQIGNSNVKKAAFYCLADQKHYRDVIIWDSHSRKASP